MFGVDEENEKEGDVTGPTKCWQCRKKLEKRADGSLIFAVFTDQIGNPHHAHKTCMQTLRAQKTITAQERQQS